MIRTDNAVLATNGFAADGKNFVKRVKQRLDVSSTTLLFGIEAHITVVRARTQQADAPQSHCEVDSDHALLEADVPLLRLQHPWRN